MKMNENINNIFSFKQNILQANLNKNVIQQQNIQEEKKSDIFETSNTQEMMKKNNKKRNIAIAVAGAIIIALIAFFKRKDIKNVVLKCKEKISNKSLKQASDKIPPIKPETVKNSVVEKSIIEKAVTEIPNAKEEIKMTGEKAIEILKKYNQDSKAKQPEIIKAIEYVTEHGLEDKDLHLPMRFFLSELDDVVISTLKFYEKMGNVSVLTAPIVSSDTSLTERSGVYKEVLNAVQQLADLTNYTKQERKDIFYSPIENLLNHSDEGIRKLAQETLEKITPKI